MVRKRCWHVLKANKSNTKPVCHLFVDVESHVDDIDDVEAEHTLWFGWAAYWRRRPEREKDTLVYRRFTSIAQFWEIALSYVQPKMPLYMVSHNVNYDFAILKIFEHLEAAGFEMYSIYLGNLAAIMRFRRGKEKIVLLDNSNFFSGKLAALGETVGFPKLDVDPLTMTEAEGDPYCKRDVEILVKLWEFYYHFLDEHDLGNWGATLPSQAFHAYRHRFMPHKIVIHANTDALIMEREAYHGGRTSVFWKGKRDGPMFYKLDVNSMYPYVMQRESYPTTLFGIRQHPKLDAIVRKLNRFAMVARVTVKTEEPVYPLVHKGHLVHPVGRFDTTLTTPEIRYALAHNHLEAVHEVALYEHAPIYKSYVEYFYALKVRYKLEGNLPFYLMTKLYQNSLYGKAGQKATEWKEIHDPMREVLEATSMRDADTGESWRLYRFGSRVWSMRPTGEANNSFPAIAAHVTAYARLYLWELIMKAGREHVFYTDTDSLVVDSVGLAKVHHLLDETALGALKIEVSSSSLEIRAPKHYRLAEEWKRKGVPGKARFLGNNTWEMIQFPSFRTQGRIAKEKGFRTHKVVKHLTDTIYDGSVGDDGWVAPLDARELQQERFLNDADEERIVQIEAQKEALNESLPIDAQTVFKLWDYRKGAFKQARKKDGKLVPIEYSSMDANATELGFSDLTGLQNAVLEYVSIRRNIAELNAERTEILYPEPSSDTQGALVF